MSDPEVNSNEAKARISEMIGALATMFPNAEISNANCKAYAKMLSDIHLPILLTVLDQCGAELKFFPSVAEIREKVTALTQPDKPPALHAWKTVIGAVQRYGYNRPIAGMQSIEAENPTAAEATRCLGWLELCNSENQVADRAHFSKIYDQLVTRQQADERLLPKSRELKQLTSGQPVIAQLTGKT